MQPYQSCLCVLIHVDVIVWHLCNVSTLENCTVEIWDMEFWVEKGLPNWPKVIQTSRLMTLYTNWVICLLAKWSLWQKGSCSYIVCAWVCVHAHVLATFPQGKYILNDKQWNVNYPYHHILHAGRLSLQNPRSPPNTPTPTLISTFNSYSLHPCSLNPHLQGTSRVREHCNAPQMPHNLFEVQELKQSFDEAMRWCTSGPVLITHTLSSLSQVDLHPNRNNVSVVVNNWSSFFPGSSIP